MTKKHKNINSCSLSIIQLFIFYITLLLFFFFNLYKFCLTTKEQKKNYLNSKLKSYKNLFNKLYNLINKINNLIHF